MPNLVGIVAPGDSESARSDALARMIRAVDLPAFSLQKREARGAGAACANLLPGMEDNLSQPVMGGDGKSWLLLDGEILNADALRRELASDGIDAAEFDDAQVAFAHCQRSPSNFFERLNGQWNLAVYDAGAGKLRLITDRIGSRILYYAHDGDRYVFATEAKGVVAGRGGPTTAGGLGLVELLSGGSHVGDRTWMEGVRLVEPGTVVTLKCNDGRLTRTQQRYFRMHFFEGKPVMSEREYAEGFARHLRAATERCMRGAKDWPVAITLSGGLDSRSVAVSIDKRHLPITSLTYGHAESADVRYAAQLAEVVGFNHRYIEPEWERLVAENTERAREFAKDGAPEPTGFLSAQLDRIVWRSEQMAPFYGLSSTIWHPIYKPAMRFMLSGAAGDAMTGSHLHPRLWLNPNRAELIAKQRAGVQFQPSSLLQQVLAPSTWAATRGELEPAFAKTFEEIEAIQPMAVSNIWDLENRQRRGAFQSFSMERYFCTCRSPYLDYDLVDYLCQVPARYRFQQRVYKKMLVEEFPEAAHVPWAYTEGKITTSPTYEFIREGTNFVRSRLAAQLPWNRNKAPRWEFRDAFQMMREDSSLFSVLDDFTNADYFPNSLSRSGVRQLGEDFKRHKDSSRGVMFAHLVGLARASAFFLSGDIQLPASADPAEFGVPVD